jgi:hypothetical protein
MKVISKKPAKSVAKRVTCEHCGARLEYVPNDVKEYHGKDISGGPDGYKWVDCANCNEEVVLTSW